MSGKNHVELDWAVDAIQVGARHRRDMGNLTVLADSIDEHGLLQPLTITEDGILVCGARRLAAIKQLGWKTTSVWVRVGLSDKLTALMAERDENISHKEFTKAELTDLYTELKAEIAADAARRVALTQFTPGHEPGAHGGENFSPPPGLGEPIRDSRVQAAAMIGGASHITMEKIASIREAAADTTRPQAIRDQASQALKDIDDGAAVDPLFSQVRSATRLDDLDRIADNDTETEQAREVARQGAVLIRKLEADTPMSPDDLDRAARAALERVKATKREKTPVRKPVPSEGRVFKKRTVKSFIWTWNEMRDWPHEYDPVAVAAGVTQPQWDQFKTTMADSIDFMNVVDGQRAQMTAT